jgi:hypothetical protein
VEPVTLGLAAAGLVAKAALEAAAGEAGESGWDALRSVGNRVRSWFGRRDDGEAVRALDVVEAAPDSASAVAKLADHIAIAARADPDEAAGLERLVDNIATVAAPEVVNFVNQVRDQARVGRIIQVGRDYHEH